MEVTAPNELLNEIALAEHAAVIRALGKRVIGDVIEMGRRLTDAKKIAGHGGWLPWLDREFGWSDDTARKLMQVSELAESRNLRDLNLPISGLYLLAAPSTPGEVRQDVIERIENGESLSVKHIKELIDEARSKQDIETAELLAVREAEIRAQYVPGLWSRKPPPEPENPKTYFLQFLRTKLHPVAEKVLPLMKADEFAHLVKSIKAHGQFDPISVVEHEGDWVILDGVCREIACGIAGVEPNYKKITVDDPCSYWMSANLMRTHLSEFQRAMADACLTVPDEDEESYDHDQLPPPIVVARYVRAHASPAYVEAVIKGTMQLYSAYNLTVESQCKTQSDLKERAELNRQRPDVPRNIEPWQKSCCCSPN
jgi:ParB-like chromosome segregation protein Spo0J